MTPIGGGEFVVVREHLTEGLHHFEIQIVNLELITS